MSPHARWRSGAARLAVAFVLTLTAGGAVVAAPLDASAAASSTTTYTASPFASRTLWVDPVSTAAKDAAATTDPIAAAALRKVASQPQADWFGDWNPTSGVASTVSSRVGQITAAGGYPVLVAYNIPKRDCSSYSGGGATSADAYRSWIKAFKAGIGTRKVAVILEPDALPQLDCLSTTDRQLRLTLLKEATQTLATGGNVAVYLDAGNAGWIAPKTIADRLSKAGVAYARGFSLNVSGYGWTADQVAYGRQVAPYVGWKRFVVDTSRNGVGPATTGAEPWCNPADRALGARPTAATGDVIVDAYLWVKHPGESDGTCNGGPTAGSWWREQAVGLAQRASW